MTKLESSLWEHGYRPFEIYTYNKTPVKYHGEIVEAGEIAGWEIEVVFSTRANLESYPFFDAIVGVDCMDNVKAFWYGVEQ